MNRGCRAWAFVFPGQGAQSTWLDDDRAPTRQYTELWLARAFGSLGISAPEWRAALAVSNRPSEVEQVAVIAASYAGAQWLTDTVGIVPTVVAGHSLGELTALTWAGALAFEDAIRIASIRGRLMDETSQARSGAMAAIVGLSASEVSGLCDRSVASDEVLEIANYNSATQLVVSGDRAAAERLVQTINGLAGRARATRLNVAGAYHSSLMIPVVAPLRAILEKVHWHEPRLPVLSGSDATPLNPLTLVHRLVDHVTSPVRWQAVTEALGSVCDVVVDVGPGTILRQLIVNHQRSSTSNASMLGLVVALMRLEDLPALKSAAHWDQRQLLRSLLLRAQCERACCDSESYRERVIAPFRALQALVQRVDCGPLSGDDLTHARMLADTVLRHKKLEPASPVVFADVDIPETKCL